jgi:predicted phosphodiesterase
MKKIVIISDTHNKHKQIKIPDGDILIHCGDFTSYGYKDEVKRFIEWFSKQTHKHKIFIAGNHDRSFDSQFQTEYLEDFDKNKYVENSKPFWLVNILNNLPLDVYYLENTTITLDNIKFFGSPQSARFGNKWAFNVDRGSAAYKHWSQIPNDVDIVITHGPTYGINDYVARGENVGDIQLLNKLNETTCKLFCCGHIHEGYGVFNDGKITHVNAATCNLQYEPTNKPIEFIWNPENISYTTI